MDKDIDAGVKEDDLGTEVEQEVENEDEGASARQEDEPNWKELYQSEHSRAENYKTAFSKKKQFVKAGVAEPLEDEDAPITKKDLNDFKDSLTPVLAQNQVKSILGELVKDPEKRRVVELIYENRIRQTGTSDEAIRADVEEAIDLAESKANKIKASELGRVIQQTKTPILSGTGSDNSPGPSKHKFSSDQVKYLTEKAKAIGANPEEFILKAWEIQKKK